MTILTAWLALGVVESGNSLIMQRMAGNPYGWSDALAANMPYWFFWALLTPVIFGLFRAFPLDQGRRTRAVLVHVVASVVLPLAHLLATGALYYYTTTRNTFTSVASWTEQVRNLISGYVVVEILFYWGILGAFYVLEFYRRYRDEELSAARLAVRTAQLESSMTEARLEALRMELNPHFLFNTLNAIAGLVRRHDNAAAVAMLARLGDLLRVTLERGAAQEITLEEELSFLERYLEIERLRFHDRLVVEMDVPEHLRSALVPTLVLQPLVENAVRHGIARRPGPGVLHVSAQERSGRLCLSVRDTGIGLSTDASPREGVGLSNTRARLAQLYGGEGSIDLAPAEGGGALATLMLPLHREEERQNAVQMA
ncbi:MAG: sensor histidine kinase [Gemmatimonadota bacterium]